MKFSATPAPLREKKQLISPRRKARKVVSDKNKSNIEVLGDLRAFAREKTKLISPRRKARKDVWGKSKINIEVLCDPCASAREKTN